MTKEEAGRNYRIPISVLDEYENWGLCGSVKQVMGHWQYDEQDLERLSLIMALHDMGFSVPEVESYMRLTLSDEDTTQKRLKLLNALREYTFLESVDVSGKTIIPFCTSGSSGIGGSMSAIRELAKDAAVLDGRRVNNYDKKKIADWLEKIVK